MKNNIYIIESNNYIFEKDKITELINNNALTNEIKNTYDLEEDLLSQVIEDIDTYSFLTPKKTIIVKNALFLESGNQNKFETDEIEHLVKYIENPSNEVLLILCTKKMDTRLKITKELTKIVTVIKEETNINEYIKQQLIDYDICFKAKQVLIDYTNEDINAVFQECNKLKMYKLDDKVITEQDVKDIVIKRLKNKDQITFDFIKFIASKNKNMALQKYLLLVDNLVDPIGVIALLESQMRLLYQVKVLKEKDMSNKEIATSLNVHPFRVDKTTELLYHYNKQDIRNFIHELADLDFNIKSGKIDSDIGLKMFVINLE